jgi:DNA polymerase sigma
MPSNFVVFRPRLHKEIVDFIDWIKPRDYEHAVRRYAIGMLRKTVQRMWNDADVRVFGSFASDLYLPTSDVDVVIVSQSYVLDDYPKYSTKRHFFEIAAAIRKSGLSRQDSVKTIANAKVPIVKYVDNATGLHIDISFENKSGLIANGTFRQWRGRYRSMPILLILLKQYLAMRGLNEVYLGGVGSFSLCCLIVSLFQQLPSVVSKEVDPSKNLGVILLEFLEFYGKRFNTRKVGIRVDLKSPGYFDKEELQPKPHNPKPQDETLLVIQDPNNADNNISRSSFMITTVLACFSEAYDTLIKQMRQFDQMDFKQRKGRSLLGTLIGGDYSEMIAHRALLRRVYVERVGKEEDMKAPPPPPRPPPPPPSDVRESFSITSTTIPSLPSHSSIPSIPAIPPPSQMPRLPPPPGLPVRPPPKQLPSPPPGLPVRPPMAPEEPSKKGSQKGKGQQSARGGKNANKKGNHGSGGGSTGNTTGGNNSGIPSVSVDKIAGNSVGGSAQGDIDEGVDGGSKNNPKKPLVIDLGNSESDNEVEIIKIKDGKSLDHIQGQGGRGEGMGVGISREGGKCEATSGGSAPLEPSGNESDPIPLD